MSETVGIIKAVFAFITVLFTYNFAALQYLGEFARLNDIEAEVDSNGAIS